ncbi:DUF3472 domain-containing protein [Aestuariibaculum suncheonense]|uniref:DUF3472 domain-containing protein n=1 Tax=Aestuariibaculum suncheonense TaxID=1028745 RepID=A0A8J6UJ49_9FLAO|nr:DUF3472 domain-containing protein [Aestuariibaculum suncheonense]MBD0836939.1 DUF3472 domain-containing protein [Aestuariibaculum suncheonense]
MNLSQTKYLRTTLFGVVLASSLFGCRSNNKGEFASVSDAIQESENKIVIPTKGNSWVVNQLHKNEEVIGDEGIHNWTDLSSKIRTYFKTTVSGKLHVAIRVRSIDGPSLIKVTLGEVSKEVKIGNNEYETIEIGDFNINEGYNFIELQGLSKTGENIAGVKDIIINGEPTNSKVYFINEDFYFGRRGPSVHLRYKTPENKDVLWYYNEINVPVGEDVLGSYYMANGFKHGYFGIQVNSENERRVLFSVWSPFKTQDPKEIPDEYKIVLLGKGQGVTTGEFGNEGSGGQSYKVFNWKAGLTYKFLLKGEPTDNNQTIYTAYFFTPEDNTWNLIASFKRPETSTYLKNFYSFLENFRTDTGYITRKANYQNQWVYTTEGYWEELTEATFTADATAKKESRMDYAGGVEGNVYFMKNCGFFNNTTEIGSVFTREANGTAPDIDFSKLETPKL